MATQAVRWFIERPNGDFDDVGALSMDIHASGSLVFDVNGVEMLAYAPGTWVAVHSEVE